MQTVGAQWLLVHTANAASSSRWSRPPTCSPMCSSPSWVECSPTPPTGRHLLIAVQAGLAIAGAALAALTFAGQISPALLLMFTFVIGSGSVFVTPAYQSLVPEIVPREDVPSAVQLNSINVNIAARNRTRDCRDSDCPYWGRRRLRPQRGDVPRLCHPSSCYGARPQL